MDKTTIFLNRSNRRMAADAVHSRPDGHVLVLQEPTRTIRQNALLHALFSDAAKHATFHGRKLSATQWKTLFISGHAVATGIGTDMVPGLEGEWTNLRESSAQMGVRRMNSLIEYVTAYLTINGIPMSAPPGYEELAA
jgi:predicted component of type VI protein secretion system